MGTSEIEYRGKEISASDSILEVWLKLLVDEFDKLENRPDWLSEMRDDWYTQATQEFGYGVVLELDEYLPEPGHREIVLRAARRARARLESFEDPVSPATLKAIGAGKPESAFMRAVPAETFIDLAWDFIDLLEEEDGWLPSDLSQHDFLQAIDAHAKWLGDPAAGRRLKVRDSQFAGAALEGICLVRAKLTRVNLRGAKLKQIKLSKSELEEVDFEDAELGRAEFSSLKIRHCNFNWISAEGITFSDTLTENTSLQCARFNGAKFAMSAFFQVSMTDAFMTSAEFAGCSVGGDLRGCDFGGSIFRGTHFRRVDLRNANFARSALLGAGFRYARLCGAHGLPFLVDEIGGSELDFSPSGDGSVMGTLATLRAQLGGGAGVGPWGSATAPEQYRALRVDDGGGQYFPIERRSDQAEVLRVLHFAVESRRLAIHYQISDMRLVDKVAQDLIFDVLLANFRMHDLRGKVDQIDYKNVETAATSSRAYDG